MLIKCDRDHLDLIIKSNTIWTSLTVLEISTNPIIDFGIDELKKYREDIQQKESEKKQYELFLRLKAKFEPEGS